MKPRIIIADPEIDYAARLQEHFVTDYFDQIELEIITDPDYYHQLFSQPQKVDLLIASEEFFDPGVSKHAITNIFWLTEEPEAKQTGTNNSEFLYKYVSIQSLMAKITGKCRGLLKGKQNNTGEPQIVVVSSASGGTGKTTLAAGIAAAQQNFYKRVLYLQAASLQSGSHIFQNGSPITGSDVYSKLSVNPSAAYQTIKYSVRKEGYDFLPPFKSALYSLSIPKSIFREIAVQAKNSGDYDFILVDTDSTFDEEKARLFDAADKVILVTEQSRAAVSAMCTLADCISGIRTNKYLFICNKFNEVKPNSLISREYQLKFAVNEYIEWIDGMDHMKLSDLASVTSIQRAALLLD